MDKVYGECELEMRKMLGWLSKAGLEVSAIRRLALSAEARQKGDWATASDLCWQLIDQARASDRISGNRDSIEGWGRMHLGAVYYCQADFAQAADHFERARLNFSLDLANQRVAQFACGAAHAWRGDRARFSQSVTPNLLAVLRTTGARDAEAFAETLESHLTQGNSKTSNPPAESIDPSDDAQKLLRAVQRHEIKPTPKDTEPSSASAQILLGVGIVLIVAAGALAVTRLAGTPYALIPYLATWGFTSFFLVRYMRHVVPPGHALVVERTGLPWVAWGADTCYLWPLIERARALVPLGPLQYTSPARTILLSADEAVTVRLFVYYGVMPAGKLGGNIRDVLNAVYNHYANTRLNKGGQASKRGKAGALDVQQIRQKWESRLLNDIVMTLNEVLPGWTRQRLSGDETTVRNQLINHLRIRLEERVREWGMVIEELNIVELNKAKA